MKVLGYVNRFNRGIGMVQEQLEANKTGLAIFDFKDITTFKVTVMNADPKPDSDTGNGIESGIDGTENGIDGTGKLKGVEADILALIKEDNRITKKSVAQKLGIGTTTVSRYISSLKDKDIIERVGSDKGGYWKIK